MAESRRGNPASFKRRRRRWIKQQGKRLVRALWDFFGRQSLIGAPPVWPSDAVSSVRPLEENWHLIRRELDALLEQRDLLPPFQTISRDQRRIAKGDRWKTFILVGFGSWSPRSVRRCPETARLLADIPDLQTAFFSILAPGYHIPPHRGITRGLVRVHLGVKVPADRKKCRIRIDQDEHHWQEGKCLVFDDTFDHEVWNETDEERVVLLLDIKRPMRWPGRLVNEIFLWGIRRSAYFTRAKIRQDRWEDRFEAAVTRADNYHLDT